MKEEVFVIGVEDAVDFRLKYLFHNFEGFCLVFWDEASLEILGIVHLCDLDGLKIVVVVVPIVLGVLLHCFRQLQEVCLCIACENGSLRCQGDPNLGSAGHLLE